VVDAGFFMMNFNRKLRQLRRAGAVKAFRNYATSATKPHKAGGRHGSKVIAYIGGSTPGNRFGLATGSEYYLAYTDENRRERRIEEDRWVAALEWLDSLGVRLVNTSLGYSTGFDNPRENHSPDSVDGHSSAITRAAERAAERGMILVVSAGNDGSNRFRVVSLPADAPSVIAVGATDATYWEKQYYSSTGSYRMNHVKPDVSVYSQTGTSFSAPVITGLIACMLERKPELSVNEVREMLFRASHLSSFPNTYIGYGVPDAVKVLDQLYGREVTPSDSVIRTRAGFVDLDSEDAVTVFHKNSPTLAYQQRRLHPADRKIRVERPPGASRSTVAFRDRPVEIIWE
jgi:subtilisin family serine protease